MSTILVAVVVLPVTPDEVVKNQAMVIGDFDGDDGRGLHEGIAGYAPSCLPRIGEVCALAAAESNGTDVKSGAPPPASPTTTTLLSAGSVTPTTVSLSLPATGAGTAVAAILGLVLVALGATLLLGTRRPRPTAD